MATLVSTLDDIDNGNIILTSPTFNVATYGEPYLSYYAWFIAVQGSGSPNDSMIVRLYNGVSSTVLAVYDTPVFGWSPIQNFKISDYLTPTATMWLEVEAFDKSPGHVVEVAFDLFEVVDSAAAPPVAIQQIPESDIAFRAYPNPFKSSITINIESLTSKSTQHSEQLQVFNQLGQKVYEQKINSAQTSLQLGAEWSAGVYWLRMGETSVKLVKLSE